MVLLVDGCAGAPCPCRALYESQARPWHANHLDCSQMSLEEFGYKEELNRALTTKDLIIYGIDLHGADRPLRGIRFSSGMKPKAMVPLAYLVGLIGMFLYRAELRRHVAGVFRLRDPSMPYAHRGLHEIAGFFSGWLILLDYILVPSFALSDQCGGVAPDFPRRSGLGLGWSGSYRSMASSNWARPSSSRRAGQSLHAGHGNW